MKAAEGPFLSFGPLAGEAYRLRVYAALGLKAVRGGRALDLGCGNGEEALYFASLGYRVDAVDLEPSPQWKTLAKRSKGRVKVKQGDASRAGKPGSYDLVFAKDMLHHAADPVAVLKRMAQLVKPGGKVLVVEANRLNPIFYVHLTLMEGHEHFTLWRLRSLLRSAGLDAHHLQRLEARVWPFERPWAQVVMNKVQDLIQAIPLLWPILCYHVVAWQRPSQRKGR